MKSGLLIKLPKNMELQRKELLKEVDQISCKDRYFMRRLIRNLPQMKSNNQQRRKQVILDKIHASQKIVQQRRFLVPKFLYPSELPITERKEEIIEAIRDYQVVVITGETGSGKTTQLPKMCLEAGRGIFGKIGCTQPRRIAATSLAKRVAQELNCQLGREVGYKIRFEEKTEKITLIQFITDGILLAEIQGDRFLNEYDCIILDEAHERTLNIDFLFGYLRQLLPKRPDLKLIITSATIDVEKFSNAFPQYYCPKRQGHFLTYHAPRQEDTRGKAAPIIEVSGRVYPVEMRYAPIDEAKEVRGDLTVIDMVKNAVEEILTETFQGDILVFMSGIQEIREAANQLKYLESEEFLVLPLFSRLTGAEQNRIFKKSNQRKIILATNIAETSITVPGVHYVIDTGRARISQYNTRSGTQGLPVKAISQSSANQRKGRCGRVSNGICIRLYSEEDFLARSIYATPEIQRSNLAEVILRMLALKLGKIETFPFIDPPESAQIRSGYSVLNELGAINEKKHLTPLGKEMTSLPVDPRTARMILQAKEENALYPVLIIASAISCQDPKEYSEDQKTQSDQKHAAFISKESDLMTLLNLWEHYHLTLAELKTQGKMRKFCRANFLSYRRIREWRDIHQQLTEIVKEKTWSADPPTNWDYDAIHRSLLTGYLSQIAQIKEKRTYQGTKNRELIIFPGSGQYSRRHEWIVATEIIETSRLFAHRVAKINPDWLESLGGDLCRKSWSEPRWDKKSSRVVVWEKVTLFGFTLVEKRQVNYGRINLEESTLIFVREALVEGKFNCKLPFWLHNQRLIQEIRESENRTRKRNLLVADETLEKFYLQRITGVSCLNDLKRIIKQRSGDKFLFMNKADLINQEPDHREELFPEHLEIGGGKCRLSYVFEPGTPQDGVTVELPWALLKSIREEPFEYLVPGLLQEKILWLMKNLTKSIRVKLVPVPEKAVQVWDEIISFRHSTDQVVTGYSTPKDFYHELSDTLFKVTKVYVEPESWSKNNLPDYLRMNFYVRNPHTNKVQQSRRLKDIQQKSAKKKDDWIDLIRPYEQHNIEEWNFGTLLEEVFLSKQGEVALWGYRTLIVENNRLNLTLCKSREDAEEKSLKALGFFLERELGEELSWVNRELRYPPETLNHFQTLWSDNPNLSLDVLQKKFGGRLNKVKNIFHEELQKKTFLLVCHGLCGYNDQNGQGLWSKNAFQRRLEHIKKESHGLGVRVVAWIRDSMNLQQQSLSLLQKSINQYQSDFLKSILNELNFFLSPDCLQEIPLEQWKHCPRILRSYLRRIEKCIQDPQSEKKKYDKVALYQLKCEALWKKRQQQKTIEYWFLTRFRWMLEELKVSVFAQDLKTAFPVSAKRLDNFLNENLLQLLN